MFRGSIVVLALASALALNGCSKCSNTEDMAPEAPAVEEAVPEATPEAAPAEEMSSEPAGEDENSAAMAPSEEGASDEGMAHEENHGE